MACFYFWPEMSGQPLPLQWVVGHMPVSSLLACVRVRLCELDPREAVLELHFLEEHVSSTTGLPRKICSSYICEPGDKLTRDGQSP